MSSTRCAACLLSLLTSVMQVFVVAQRASASSFTTFQVANAGPDMGSSAINDAGVVVGSYQLNGVDRAFVRAADGAIVTFRQPGTGHPQRTEATAISADGAVTGYYYDGVWHGFVRHANGKFSRFDAPGAGTGLYQGTVPTAINAAGVITGFLYDGAGVIHGFVRDSTGAITTFEAPGAGTASNQGTLPMGINEAGTITGYATGASGGGFLRTANGTFTALQAPGGEFAFSFGVNTEGAATGWYYDANNVIHGFARSTDGTVTMVDAPGAGIAGGQGTYAYAINARGEILGTYVDGNSVFHAFVRRVSGAFGEEVAHRCGNGAAAAATIGISGNYRKRTERERRRGGLAVPVFAHGVEASRAGNQVITVAAAVADSRAARHSGARGIVHPVWLWPRM